MTKILIVVNQAELRRELKHMFILKGHKTVTATSGVDAINILLMFHFDIVICDQDLEYGDGHWLMRQSHALRHQPKFVMITEDKEIEKEKFLQAGVSKIYHPPVVAEELYQCISEISN